MRPPVRFPAPEDFPSPLHDRLVAARLGAWLGICFLVAFLTGLVSSWAQAPDPWVPFPTRPVWGYRVTQGLHVAAGTAAVPLLLAKLWTVYPHLFARPPRRPVVEIVRHSLERASIAALVASALFLLVTGTMNVTGWYPWTFSFRPAHHAVSWVAIGALAVHLAVKMPLLPPRRERAATADRRGFLVLAAASAGVAVLTTSTAGVPGLRRLAVLAPRSGDGPAGLPVNRTAVAAGVTATATAASWRLTVVHGDRELVLDQAGVAAMEQRTEDLPIACVEGWSAGATWSGVRVRDLLDAVGAPRGRDVRVVSLQTRGAFGVTVLTHPFADDDRTLLATHLSGERLPLDHGFPCRLIAPNRPGVLQTKWVTRLEVLA